MNEKQRHSLAWAYILRDPFVLAYDFNLLQRRNEVTFLTIVNREFFTHWRSPVEIAEISRRYFVQTSIRLPTFALTAAEAI